MHQFWNYEIPDATNAEGPKEHPDEFKKCSLEHFLNSNRILRLILFGVTETLSLAPPTHVGWVALFHSWVSHGSLCHSYSFL